MNWRRRRSDRISEDRRSSNNTSNDIDQHEDDSNLTNPRDVSSLQLLQKAQLTWKAIFGQAENQSKGDPYEYKVKPARKLTMENQRANIPWGEVLKKKEPNCTRIYVQNVNGLSFDRRGGQFNDVCQVITEVQADIFGGQEHNLDTTQMQIRSTLYDTARQYWPRNRMTFGTTPITFKSNYKPGGTFLVTVGNASGRVLNQNQDRWGRWVTQELSGKDGIRVVIISAYQPVEKYGPEGNLSVSAQQRSLLLQTQDNTDNPRTAFRRDLLAVMRQYNTQGTDILLVGDFNEPFASDPDGLSYLASELSLVNLMPNRHSSTLPATYARGTKCIDYALASPRLSHALVHAGYEPFNARLSSDHRGYFIDFDTVLMFGRPTQDLASPGKRKLKATNLIQVTAYINKKYELLNAHNAFERVERLSYIGDRHQYAERLDNDVVAASLAAEDALPQFGAPAWSVELKKARTLVQLLTKVLLGMRTGFPYQQDLQTIQEMAPTQEVPSSATQCSRLPWKAKLEVRLIENHSFTRRDEERKQRLLSFDKSTMKADRATAKVLRRLKKAEDLNDLFSKLKRVRATNPRTGVVRLEIPLHPAEDPKSCSEWTQVDIPSDVLRLLQSRNRLHFGQAHGTPFTIPPLSDVLGYTGYGEAQQQMLTGTFNCQGYDENVRL